MANSGSAETRSKIRSAYILPAVSALTALAATFVVSNAALSFETKSVVFAVIIAIYLGIETWFRFSRSNQTDARETDESYNEEIEEKLLALEEAGEYFGASLKSEDMFRLVAGRVNEIVPFSTCVLYLFDESREILAAAHAFGPDAKNFENLEINPERGLANRVLKENKACTDDFLIAEKTSISTTKLVNLRSAAAIALRSETGSFGVLTLYSDRENAFKKRAVQLLEAVGARVSPLFLGSLAHERNRVNALTDHVTSLPNERAFFLVLESQIAESQRFRDQRPLTLLMLDIKNFDELNKRCGHHVGDRILNFTGRLFKDCLRRMDFPARARGDEFCAVLPTATEEITRTVIDRITETFATVPFEDSTAGIREFIEVSFGAATFPHDGETAQQLLEIAALRKKHEKTGANGSVLWFPTEYISREIN